MRFRYALLIALITTVAGAQTPPSKAEHDRLQLQERQEWVALKALVDGPDGQASFHDLNQRAITAVKRGQQIRFDPPADHGPCTAKEFSRDYRLNVDLASHDLDICQDEERDVAGALDQFYEAHHRYPRTLSELIPKYLPYLANCPMAQRETYSAGYRVFADNSGYQLVCTAHGALQPKYDSAVGRIPAHPPLPASPDAEALREAQKQDNHQRIAQLPALNAYVERLGVRHKARLQKEGKPMSAEVYQRYLDKVARGLPKAAYPSSEVALKIYAEREALAHWLERQLGEKPRF